MITRAIYMDNNATTPVDPVVLEVMLPYFTEKFGNAASRNHAYGWEAEEAVENARAQIAAAVGADPKEIIFTSGATESNNLALKGVAEVYREKGNHIITVVTEHKCILDSAKYLEQHGCRITYLPVKPDGLIDLAELEAAITPETVLISVMFANNEIGVIQPVAEIAKIAKSHGVLFHTDAAQALGKVPIDVQALGIDLMSMSGHKLYGPKGIGALYVRRKNPRVRLEAQLHGGGHERGMRSGTLYVPLIVGMGAAAERAVQNLEVEAARTRKLRERLLEQITGRLSEVYVNGSLEHRLSGNLNLSFAFVEGEALLMGLNDTVALSSGSACTSASLEPSYVLKALGVGDELAHSSLRFGIGRFNTEEDIDRTSAKIVEVVNRLREMSPLWEMHQEGIDLKQMAWPPTDFLLPTAHPERIPGHAVQR
ncbi:IscS subfamily cysteine desulfurase [Gloeobacter violaceus]|uniref:Cysteine desulfurase IscS n=1 Tax=Gloeobacter violaceus (strain ATCC 29082 / PCC 7421) TaxID=251221 RepID=Q7ND52_GLOVI|nr:IscS subfamily cysteine desulfurase [Gloeobacter violaceus]BAC92325.1 cysteine desulfurase [Gloeobacter violaceus PCC 7421]